MTSEKIRSYQLEITPRQAGDKTILGPDQLILRKYIQSQ
jgi:hypothetical protein